MDDQDTNGPFGDLGDITYDAEAHRWHFSRAVNEQYHLLAVRDEVWRAQDDSKLSSKAEHQNTRLDKLLFENPELQASRQLLPALSRLSSAVQDATKQYDANVGNLMSVGLVYDHTRNRLQQVLAWAGCETGSNLIVSRLMVQKQGWHDTQLAGLKVPVLGGHQAVWQGPGAPIQQVCFAQSSDAERAPFLAARLLDRTVVFHVTCESWALELTVLHEISHDGQQGSLHSSVVFSPFYTRQYALIDGFGHWEVWQLEAKSTPALSAKHSIDVKDSDDDGWRRLIWTGGPSTMAICTRTRLMLCNVDTGIVKNEIVISLDRPDCWILDAMALPTTPRHLFVLTGTDVLAFEIEEDGEQVKTRKLLKLKHYINIRDLTLRLRPYAEADDLVLQIESRLSGVSLCFKIADFGSVKQSLIAITSCQLTPRESIIETILLPIQSFCYTPYSPRGTVYDAHMRNAQASYNLLCLLQDRQLTQTLICATTNLDITFQNVQWRKRLRIPHARYITDDEDDDEESGKEVFPIVQPVSSFLSELRAQPKNHQDLRWTIDLSKAVSRLSVQSQPLQDIREVVSAANGVLQVNGAFKTIGLLSDLAAHGATTTDLDQADEELQKLLDLTTESSDGADQKPHLIADRLADLVLTAMPSSRLLSAVYDSIVADWILPLPQSISTDARVMREKLAREAAAQITLASHTISLKQPIDTEESTQLAGSQEFEERPFVGSSQQYLSQASALPTPSPTATPSVLTQASSTYAPHKWNITSVTSFSKSLPISLPRSSQRVLQHWEIGADLEKYDWQQYSRRITRQAEVEDFESQLTEKERVRLQRKADRQIKRSRKEAAATQEDMDNQLPQVLVSASQPAPRDRVVSASSPPRQGFMSSSQVLPAAASQAVTGRFGGRPVKKKRKQGF